MSSPVADDPTDFIDDNEDDLFGDGDGDDQADVVPERTLDDDELDSDDDVDRNDRVPAPAEQDDDVDDRVHQLRTMDSRIGRHPIPTPSDGNLRSLRMPKFLAIEPREYNADTFRPPTSDHHSEFKSPNFSAHQTAMTTMRYRTSKAGDTLESNTLIHRWSDGSITLSIGDQHYELQQKPLAPPKDAPYKDVFDSHEYLAAAHWDSQLMMVTGHLSSQYTVQPNQEVEDDAIERLRNGYSALTHGNGKTGIAIIESREDPELQKRQAEIAEKERNKLQRKRESAQTRADAQVGRFRSGGRGYGGVDLSIDDLEDGGRRAAAPRKRAAPKKKKRARSDYSDEEEEYGGGPGRGRQDEYDLEDDFVASSNEGSPEPGGDDDDEEEILDDESDDGRHKSKKQKTSKPQRRDTGSDVDADGDEDAEGEADDEISSRPADAPVSGRGRRNIIEDDDDE